MNIKKLLPTLALVVAIIFATTAPLFAGDKKDKGGEPKPGAVGKIVSVESGKITITTKEGKKTYTTDASTAVVGGKEGATLADLKPGWLVKLLTGSSDDAPITKVKIFKMGE